jgi:hypothetical protein
MSPERETETWAAIPVSLSVSEPAWPTAPSV